MCLYHEACDLSTQLIYSRINIKHSLTTEASSSGFHDGGRSDPCWPHHVWLLIKPYLQLSYTGILCRNFILIKVTSFTVWVETPNYEFTTVNGVTRTRSCFGKKATSLRAEAEMWLANHVRVNKSQPQARAATLPVQRYTQHTVSILLYQMTRSCSNFQVNNSDLNRCHILPLLHHLSSPPAEPSLLWWSWLLCPMPEKINHLDLDKYCC